MLTGLAKKIFRAICGGVVAIASEIYGMADFSRNILLPVFGLGLLILIVYGYLGVSDAESWLADYSLLESPFIAGCLLAVGALFLRMKHPVIAGMFGISVLADLVLGASFAEFRGYENGMDFVDFLRSGSVSEAVSQMLDTYWFAVLFICLLMAGYYLYHYSSSAHGS